MLKISTVSSKMFFMFCMMRRLKKKKSHSYCWLVLFVTLAECWFVFLILGVHYPSLASLCSQKVVESERGFLMSTVGSGSYLGWVKHCVMNRELWEWEVFLSRKSLVWHPQITCNAFLHLETMCVISRVFLNFVSVLWWLEGLAPWCWTCMAGRVFSMSPVSSQSCGPTACGNTYSKEKARQCLTLMTVSAVSQRAFLL